MITDVPGVRIGHWTDGRARTGCTVVLFADGTVASGEVRGGAPAEREMALLEPSRLVSRLDAVLLTGGSAFGLAAADGVMRYCEEQGMGVPTAGGRVPIVVGLGLYDLDVGDASVRPGAAEGYAACRDAVADGTDLGSVGAGTGARVDRIAAFVGDGEPFDGGLVSAAVHQGDLVVGVLLAVNALGSPRRTEAGMSAIAEGFDRGPSPLGNTTIGVVATNARLDKVGCFLVAQSAHGGLARGLFPSHTRFDGDAFVAASVGDPEVGRVDAEVDAVRVLAAAAVARAVGDLVPR